MLTTPGVYLPVSSDFSDIHRPALKLHKDTAGFVFNFQEVVPRKTPFRGPMLVKMFLFYFDVRLTCIFVLTCVLSLKTCRVCKVWNINIDRSTKKNNFVY
jgi:hypothetical protein